MIIYEHVNYQGSSKEITSDTPDLRTLGAWNDQASSVRVPSGGSVTLYEHINYGGASLVLTSDAPDLRAFPGPGADGTWNDAASSVKLSTSTERLKSGDKYIECSASGFISLNITKTDASKVKITKHDDKHYDVLFVQANKTLSVQPDGTLQSRPAGTYDGYENLDAITAPDPNQVNLIYRVHDGLICGGTVLQIVSE